MPWQTNPLYTDGDAQGAKNAAVIAQSLGSIFGGGDPMERAKAMALGGGYRKDLAAAALDEDELAARQGLGDVFGKFMTQNPDGTTAMLPEADFRAATIRALPDLIRAGEGANVRDILSIPGIASGDDDLAQMGSLFLRPTGVNDAFSLADREKVAGRNAANDKSRALAVQSLENAGALERERIKPLTIDQQLGNVFATQPLDYKTRAMDADVFGTSLDNFRQPDGTVLPVRGGGYRDDAGAFVDVTGIEDGSLLSSNAVSGDTAKALGFGVTANNALGKTILDTDSGLNRLADIKSKLNDKYLTIPFQAEMLGTSLLDKTGMADIDPESEAQLRDYSQFRRSAVQNLNATIREITGATLSPGEAGRISMQLPNPGLRIFDGDSPIEFKAKLDDAEQYMRAAQARAVDLKTKGIGVITDEVADQYPLENYMNFNGGEDEDLPDPNIDVNEGQIEQWERDEDGNLIQVR